MSRLVKFTTVDGFAVWLNPAFVSLVQPEDEEEGVRAIVHVQGCRLLVADTAEGAAERVNNALLGIPSE